MGYLTICCLCVVVLYSAVAEAVILKPIRPHELTTDASSLGRRAVATSDLDLRSEDILLWGQDDIIANLTVYMPGDSEGLLNMERFDSMLAQTICTNESVSLRFKDSESFLYAQKVWDWVNGADNHTFVMIAGAGDCGWNKERQPFTVSKIDYDAAAFSAHLTAHATEFTDVVHSFDIHLGQNPSTLQRRGPDYHKGAKFDISTSISPSLKFEEKNLKGEIKCDGCGTSGALDVEFDLKTFLGVPTSAQISISPMSLKVPIPVTITLTDTFPTSPEPKKAYDSFDVMKIPLPYSITIPHNVLHVGPAVDMELTVEISNMTGSATISTGWTASVSDNSLFQLDLLDKSHNDIHGWVPDVQALPTRIDAKITAGAAAAVKTSVKLEANVLKRWGYEVALGLEAPKAELKMTGIASSSGICKKSDGSCSTSPSDTCPARKRLGVELEASAKAGLKLTGGKSGEKPFFEMPIGSDLTIYDKKFCFPFGSTVGGGNSPSPSPPGNADPSPTPGSGSTPPPPSGGGSGGDKCKINSGDAGICKSTSSCTSSGGFSEAGHCPGGKDNQCCVVKTCKLKSGPSGTCKSTSSCDGTSTPGYCPGASNIQCCTPKKATPKPPPTCKVDGISGTCIGTGACKDKNGISTPGHCPGGKDIQCCTPSYGTCKYDSVRKGDCLSTSACDSKNGIRKAGLCPGPSNIQCCTTDYGQCKANGVTGACISGQACKGQDGIRISGKCPDVPGIVCCAGGPGP